MYLTLTNSYMMQIAVRAIASIPRSTPEEILALKGLITSGDLQARLTIAKNAVNQFLLECYVNRDPIPPIPVDDLYPIGSLMATYALDMYNLAVDIQYIIDNAATLEEAETLVTYLNAAQNQINLFYLSADFQVPTP